MDETKNGSISELFLKNRKITLDAASMELLNKIFKKKTIQKDMYFLYEDEPPTEIGFVVKGLFRSFYVNNKGDDITKHFYPEGYMLFSYAAYLAKTKSTYYIQALEDSEIMAANIYDLEEALKNNYQLLLFYKQMLDEMLVMKEEHATSFKLLSNIERYKQFHTDYPGLENRVKQYQLASYLGITPVSLSRIRNKLHLNK